MINSVISSLGQSCYLYFVASPAERDQALLESLSDHIEDNDIEALKAALEPLPLDVFTNRTEYTARTLLMLAARNNDDDMHLALFCALDEKLAEKDSLSGQPNADFEFVNHLNTPYYRAIIDAQDHNGNTALMLAVQADNEAGVRNFHRLGADFFIENANGQTVLNMVEHLESPVAEFIREHMPVYCAQG